MEIYLLRHAPAVERGTRNYPSDDRPLTGAGIAQMTVGASALRALLPRLDAIVSSPLVRARETARIVARALRHRRKILISKELLPDAAPADAMQFLKKFSARSRLLLVGHRPNVGMLASALLGSRVPVVKILKGGICRIDAKEIPGHIIWLLTPRQLRSLGST